MKNNLIKIWMIVLGFGSLVLHGCGGSAPQVSGIVAKTEFSTTACVPLEKTMQIRNNDSEEAQRIQGVYFELGTNQFDKEGNPPDPKKPDYTKTYVPFYKIEEITANGTTKTVVGNLQEDIMLAPGATMSVKVSYNPKAVTKSGVFQKTYLDVFLNGPKLGIMQIELDGQAETAAPGCGQDSGNTRTFQVVSIDTTLDDKDVPNSPVKTILNLATDVKGDFKFTIDGDKVVLPIEGWPEITLTVPPGQAQVTSIPVILSDDSGPGTFSNGEIDIKDLTLLASGIPIGGIEIGTGTVTVSATDAAGGSFSLTGKALDDTSGEMTLVLAIALTNDAFNGQSVFNGAFGAEIQLKEKK